MSHWVQIVFNSFWDETEGRNAFGWSYHKDDKHPSAVRLYRVVMPDKLKVNLILQSLSNSYRNELQSQQDQAYIFKSSIYRERGIGKFMLLLYIGKEA